MIRLLELRRERGLSQREVAREFNVSQSTYNNWENANTQPSIDQLIGLARFFEVFVDYLVGNSDEAGTITFTTTLSAEEKRMLDAYSTLPPSLRSACKTVLDALADK